MIRPATSSDIPAMAALGRNMHAESRYRDHAWDDEKVRSLIAGLIASEDGLAMVAEQGRVLVGGILCGIDEHWSLRARYATEYALFVTPRARGSLAAAMLLRHYRAWALARGVTPDLIECSVATQVRTESTSRLLERCGFEYAGPVFSAIGESHV